MATREELAEKNREYQRRYRERKLQEQAKTTEAPAKVVNTPELDQLYERKEELEVELDMVSATIRFKEYKARVKDDFEGPAPVQGGGFGRNGNEDH